MNSGLHGPIFKFADEGKKVGLHYCQICQEDITSLSVDGRFSHVNACIDNNGTQGQESEPS